MNWKFIQQDIYSVQSFAVCNLLCIPHNRLWLNSALQLPLFSSLGSDQPLNNFGDCLLELCVCVHGMLLVTDTL